MANRVEFTDKNGNVKNMDKPLAMRLQSRKFGKITKNIRVGNKNSAKILAKLEEELLNSEIKVEELTKKLEAVKQAKKSANKQDKTVLNNK